MSSPSPDSCLPTPDRTSDDEILVRVENVSKKFCRNLKKSLWYGVKDIARELLPLPGKSFSSGTPSEAALRPGEFWANQGISFELRRGECLGLIGHNGAGKTTLLKMLNGLIKPDTGSIEMRGRVGALIALGAGFNPILTGRENVYVNGAILGLSKAEVDERIDEIIDFAEIRDFIDSPVQSYSSGMQVRLGFAVASALQPDVLIIDEVLAVGDMDFRMKCLARVYELIDSGTAVILVSHSMVDIQRICSRTLVLDHGRVEFCGDVSKGIARYETCGLRNRLTQTGNKGTSNDASLELFSMASGENSSSGAYLELQTGDDWSLSFQIRTPQAIDDARVRVFIQSARAGLIASISSATETNLKSLSAGVHQLRVEFPCFPLLVGGYTVGVSIHGNGTKIYYSSNQLGWIEVTGPDIGTMARGNAGLLVMKSHWQVAVTAEPACA